MSYLGCRRKANVRFFDFPIGRFCIAGLVACVAWGARAATLTVDRVQQRYPWTSRVDVDYTVSGMTDDVVVEDWRVEFALDAVTNGVSVHVPLTSFEGVLSYELPSSNGTYRVTWRAEDEAPGLFATNAVLTGALVYDPVREADADYLVLTLPKAVGAWTTRYVRAPAMPTSVFNADLFKTEKIVLKRVPHGEFWMGVGDVSSGTARHRVRLTDDFFLGVFETTSGQYDRLVNSTAGTGRNAANNMSNRTLFGAKGPFTNLNAHAIHVAGTVTNAVTGFGLPTEAQWEYACRAGWETARFYNLSDLELKQYARFSGNASDVPSDNVGCLKPNPWGFYDILGNVWERIYGSNEPYPAYSETEVTENPVTDDRSSDLYGVQRGGAYTGGADQQKSGLRSTLTKGDFIVNDYAHKNSGFRLAKQIAAGAHVTPETNATASVSGVAVDFSSAAVRKILVTNEILSVAWSTGSAWPAGGGAQEAELREVTCAYVTVGDPSTWSEGATKTLMTASSGEGTCGWIPTLQGAYKLVWLIDGSRCGEACFDCTETQGVRGGIPIDEAVVSVPPQVLVATGEPLMPTGVTVRLDGVLLREGIDYSLRGSGNLAPGTATVTAYGSGGYAGSSSASFAILPSTATDLAQGAGAAVEPGDFTTNAWRTVRNRSQLRRFTYSPTNFTGCAGTTAASRAVVSVAPMTPGAEDDLTTWTVREGERTTLADRTEEGTVRWKASCGVWQARFDIVTGAKTNHTETAIFDLRRFTSGLVLRLR